MTRYEVKSKKYSIDAKDFKILQLSDIHSLRSYEQIGKIISKVKRERPDIIFITGDLIDSRYYNEQNNLFLEGKITMIEEHTIAFMETLLDLADVFYVYGNHEMMLLDDPSNNVFKVTLEDMGVQILNNKISKYQYGESTINIIGLQDPATLYKDPKYAYVEGSHQNVVNAILDDLMLELTEEDLQNFTILLSHRPEYFDLYQEYPLDLVFSGHTHGGLVRLPLLGGLYAHPDGFFPDYSGGRYKTETMDLIVNRGIAYPKVPIRIFNPPEIVTVTFK